MSIILGLLLSFTELTIVLGYLLRGKSSHSLKEADASVKKSRAIWPAVVLEAGIGETTENLYEDVNRWLEGSCGQTKLVILVDVEESEKPDILNDNRELSEIDFQPSNHVALIEKILQWYQSQVIRLVGSFELSVHLYYSDGDNQCNLNKAAFSPNNLIDLTTIQDVPLKLDHLITEGSSLDMSQPLLFPLRCLVHTLQNGFEGIEIFRANNLLDNELRSYYSL